MPFLGYFSLLFIKYDYLDAHKCVWCYVFLKIHHNTHLLQKTRTRFNANWPSNNFFRAVSAKCSSYLTACRNDSVCLHLKTSKTDPFRQGITVRIEANNTFLCPVNALRHYVASHPNPQGPLFVFKNGTFLTRADVNALLKSTTNGAANVSSHSLRIGAASTAAAMGCPKYLIQSMGRWSSDCFRRYIRISDSTLRSASRALASCNIPVPLDFDPST